MNSIIRLYCLLLILLISACTTPGPSLTPTGPITMDRLPSSKLSAKNLTFWQIKGKIAVQTARDSGSAMVNWTQQNQHFNLYLLSPLGTPALTLTGQPGRVLLSTSDGKKYTAKTPEQLLSDVWGWHLPVSYLQYWIRGLPVPALAITNKQYDASQRFTYLKQGEWEIQFLDYLSVGQIDLPNKMTISSPTFQTKIIIYEWKIK